MSAPPASAHLAVKPVPAPAPTTRFPCPIVSSSLFVHSNFEYATARSFPLALHVQHRQQVRGSLIGKLRVVDVRIYFYHRNAGPQVFADSLEAGSVSIGIPKRTPRAVQHRDTLQRNEHRDRARGGIRCLSE